MESDNEHGKKEEEREKEMHRSRMKEWECVCNRCDKRAQRMDINRCTQVNIKNMNGIDRKGNNKKHRNRVEAVVMNFP